MEKKVTAQIKFSCAIETNYPLFIGKKKANTGAECTRDIVSMKLLKHFVNSALLTSSTDFIREIKIWLLCISRNVSRVQHTGHPAAEKQTCQCSLVAATVM